ncbi:molybdopterin biosynthesis enzyme [Moorella thermoacetica Y72]|uniref:Molybdopterin molybdenumtransferase n=1 Tax=Moorella thermoacetica Y72 TaxID=1325331 RepID=A0A0S6UCS0_NEOTH|nr:molybdopterin molybdenumtransferase [Moorella thermoacetica]OIQ54859.1 molybdopterin molybdenumtransferase [Moorella thermoacetica]OIQ59407.1 molybdopterin molybdenumtransferase [Moorella thermoacetica]GAF25372.1 molybdopterin biosynthesis enzyme [Moorella thermoacetica Y72]
MLLARKVFVPSRPWQEALEEFLGALRSSGYLAGLPTEEIDVTQALGRVTAAPVYAAISSPHYPAAAMDGIAVRAETTFGASEQEPLELALDREAVVVDTGDPLPEGFDAVIMVEEVAFQDKTTAIIKRPAVPGQNVRPVGEDITAGEMLVPAGHSLTPYDLGGLLAAGVTRVTVRPRPRVAILPTGTEIVPPNPNPAPGEILESNGTMLAALVSQWGGVPEVYPITPDDYQLLKERLDRALEEKDLVLINAGSSAGRDDYTARLVEETGHLLTHGVATRPGKPVILGIVRDKPVIGVPGYPVSAALCAELFAKPVLYYRQGIKPPAREQVRAVLGRKIHSPLGREEFVRVRLEREGDRLVATPTSRGAGTIMALARADGIVVVPRLSEGFPAGQEVTVNLLRPLSGR